MCIRRMIVAAALAAGIGALILPALAQDQGGSGSSPDQRMTADGGMGHGIMGRGMMRGIMMSGGCADMMQSMNDGDRQPNSQWRRSAPGDAT